MFDFDDGIRLDVDAIVIVAPLLDRDEDDLGDSKLELSWWWLLLLRYSSTVPLGVAPGVSDDDEDDDVDDVGDDNNDEDDGELDLCDLLCDLIAAKIIYYY